MADLQHALSKRLLITLLEQDGVVLHLCGE
jgi:hypothetical protein